MAKRAEQCFIPTPGGTTRRTAAGRRSHHTTGARDAGDRSAPIFAPSPGLTLTEISRYDEHGPAWYWNTLNLGEHTGTHFDAPVGSPAKIYPQHNRHDPVEQVRWSRLCHRRDNRGSDRIPISLQVGARPSLGNRVWTHPRRGLGIAAYRLERTPGPRGFPECPSRTARIRRAF